VAAAALEELARRASAAAGEPEAEAAGVSVRRTGIELGCRLDATGDATSDGTRDADTTESATDTTDPRRSTPGGAAPGSPASGSARETIDLGRPP
jgi:hypothetical protein